MSKKLIFFFLFIVSGLSIFDQKKIYCITKIIYKYTNCCLLFINCYFYGYFKITIEFWNQPRYQPTATATDRYKKYYFFIYHKVKHKNLLTNTTKVKQEKIKIRFCVKKV